MKNCKYCGKEKELSEFYAQEKTNAKGEKYTYYPPDCKECTKNKFTEWRKENKEQYNKTQRKIHSQEKWVENKKVRDQRWRDNGGQTRWQRNNPEKMKQYRNERELIKKHEITEQEWEDCKKYFNHRCAYCDLKIEEHYIKYKGKLILGDFHREHVDDNGANDLSNCIPSCKSCNTSKHDSRLEDWYNIDNENFSDKRLIKIIKWLEEDYKLYIR